MLAKCVLMMMGLEAKKACKMDKLCGGLDVWIEGGVHAVWLLWHQHDQEEDWEFLLIDACNAINEENHTDLMWAVCQECPSGDQFALNLYYHWDTLVIRAGDRTGHLLYSKEGVTQGDPLAMVAYGLGPPPPLIRELRKFHPSLK